MCEHFFRNNSQIQHILLLYLGKITKREIKERGIRYVRGIWKRRTKL